jgi:hypothetical protein
MIRAVAAEPEVILVPEQVKTTRGAIMWHSADRRADEEVLITLTDSRSSNEFRRDEIDPSGDRAVITAVAIQRRYGNS